MVTGWSTLKESASTSSDIIIAAAVVHPLVHETPQKSLALRRLGIEDEMYNRDLNFNC